MSLAHLPPELYFCILDYVHDQQTVLALTRCLPYAGIPVDRLFHSISIRQPETVLSLYQRIRAGLAHAHNISDASHLVYHLSVEIWNVDADVLTNLLRLLPNLRTLVVWIGPNNFSPEHLEEMLKPPMHKLNYLSLRFRPYVKKATYYQFHAGSYFDSTLLVLSAWPRKLPTLSIVQDTLASDPDSEPHLPRFAQPIVFFRLDLHLSTLIRAHTSLASLRIRIPARQIVQPLVAASAPHPHPHAQHNLGPDLRRRLRFLDIATCSVSESDIERLLIHFPSLEHLVLDACTNLPIVVRVVAASGELEWWRALGKRMAMVGVRRAREREREVRRWYEENWFYRRWGEQLQLRDKEQEQEQEREREPRRPRPKRGRRGLGTPTISLRETTTGHSSSSASHAGPSRTNNAESTDAHAHAHPQSKNEGNGNAPLPKVHIVPPLPNLRSISFFPTQGTIINPDVRVLIKDEFERGWSDGMRVLWDARERIGTTFVREMGRDSEGDQEKGKGKNRDAPWSRFFVFGDRREGGEEREGHEGLDGVRLGEEDMFFRGEEGGLLDSGRAPVLCLAGSDVGACGHEPGCGHFVGREVGLESL